MSERDLRCDAVIRQDKAEYLKDLRRGLTAAPVSWLRVSGCTINWPGSAMLTISS